MLASMNTILHERQLEQYYCTLCYALSISSGDRRARQLRAAVPGPLQRRHGARRSCCRVCRSDRLPARAYDEVSFDLVAGDVYVFCTDGVFEASDAAAGSSASSG